MTASSVNELRELLEKSNLLTEDQLRKVLTSDDATADPSQVIRQLVKEGAITVWQSGKLLSGFTDFVVGEYRLEERVSIHDWGNKYLASHLKSTRKVLVSVIDSDLSVVSDRQAELDAITDRATQADSVRLCRIESASWSMPRCYVVSERPVGQNLRSLVKERGKLRKEEVGEILLGVLEGVSEWAAYDLPVVELKPSTIFVEFDGNVRLNLVDEFIEGAIGSEVTNVLDGNQKEATDSAYVRRIGRLGLVMFYGREVAKSDVKTTSRIKMLLLASVDPTDPDCPASLDEIRAKINEWLGVRTTQRSSVSDVKPSLAPTAPNELADLVSDNLLGSDSDSGSDDVFDLGEPSQDMLTSQPEFPNEKTPAVAARTRRRISTLEIIVAAGVILSALILVLMITVFWLIDSAAQNRAVPGAERVENQAVDQQVMAGAPAQDEDPIARLLAEHKEKPSLVPDIQGMLLGSAERRVADPPDRIPALPAPPNPELEEGASDVSTVESVDRQSRAVATDQGDGEVAGKPDVPEVQPKQEALTNVANSTVDATDEPKPGANGATVPTSMVASSESVPINETESVTPSDLQNTAKDTKTTESPFMELPVSVDLPPLNRTVVVKKTVENPVSLFALDGAGDHPLFLKLIGGDVAFKDGFNFQLESNSSQSGQASYDVLLTTPPQRGDAGRKSVIGHLGIASGQIRFHWFAKAMDDDAANYLRNCLLEIRSGNHTALVALRRPVRLAPVTLDDEERRGSSLIELAWAPASERMQVEVLPLDQNFPAHRFVEEKRWLSFPEDVAKINFSVRFSNEMSVLLRTGQAGPKLTLEAGSALALGNYNGFYQFRMVETLRAQAESRVQQLRVQQTILEARGASNSRMARRDLRAIKDSLVRETDTMEKMQELHSIAQTIRGKAIQWRIYHVIGDSEFSLATSTQAPIRLETASP